MDETTEIPGDLVPGVVLKRGDLALSVAVGRAIQEWAKTEGRPDGVYKIEAVAELDGDRILLRWISGGPHE